MSNVANKGTVINISNRRNVTRFTITIAGDADIILNKMNAVTERQLLDKQANKAKKNEVPNEWESIITSMHWINGTPEEFTEESFVKNLDENVNAPCISAFGLKKSLGDAVIRNEIDKYRTKFDANVNIISKNNLIPIKFYEHYIDEKLIPAKKGVPVRSILNRFRGWTATFEIEIMGNVFSPDQIANIIDLAGFGIGIGSGRSSGYGRYHIVDINGQSAE